MNCHLHRGKADKIRCGPEIFSRVPYRLGGAATSNIWVNAEAQAVLLLVVILEISNSCHSQAVCSKIV